MRHLRLAAALLLALALSAEGLVAHAARAHRTASALAAADLCIPSPDSGDRHHDRDCPAHCLAAPATAAAPPPRETRLPAPAGAPSPLPPITAAGRRLASLLALDHAPRGPPAAA